LTRNLFINTAASIFVYNPLTIEVKSKASKSAIV